MFRSIRWRLVTSYVLLTLLAVTAVGFLALWSVKRYALQQEQSTLAANAEAIAHQALPLLRKPVLSRLELAQLAEAASFFGNVRVRILDSHRQVLADSGMPGGVDEAAWFLLPGSSPGFSSSGTPEKLMEVLIVALPSLGEISSDEDPYAFLEELPPGFTITTVRRRPGPWGNQVTFGRTSEKGEIDWHGQTPAPEEPQRSQRVLTFPIGEKARPAGWVELSAGTDFEAEALATTRRAFLLAGGGAVLLAGLLGLLMGRRLTAPLAGLTEAAERMSGGDLSARAPDAGQDEIGRLAVQFNTMARQLQSSFAQLAAERDSLRRFIADASHELRTPITALRNFNELMQGPASDDYVARAEFLVESEAQIERLEWITQNLLDLSRLEAGLAALDLAPHDLHELVDESLLPFRPQAEAKGIGLYVELPEQSLKVRADRARFMIALSNLLNNALKFTPSGGEVRVGAVRAGEGVRLWVQDNGPGISSHDLPHIFERFYRGQGVSQPGSGLGLAIVQSIVQAHDGRITVDAVHGGGTRFTLDWPS